MLHRQPPKNNPWYKTTAGIACLSFMGVAAFYLILEHRAHLYGAWPFLIILICPLMHFFMHGHHGGHHDNHQSDSKEK